MSLLEMSFSAALFIIAVIGFRYLLLHKVPKITFVILWGVALFRLLVPVSFPSPFSIFTVLNELSEGGAEQEGNNLAQSYPVASGGSSLTMPMIDSLAPAAAPVEVSPSISSLMLIWLGGVVLCALFFIIPHIRHRRSYAMSLPIENELVRKWRSSNRLWRKVQIRQLDTISTPFTYGLFKPVVLLPKHINYSDERQLGLILTHEYVHIRRFDVLKKWLLAIALCIHWFNPLVWVMYILANRDIELSCDETVVWKCGEAAKPAYAMALVHLEEKRSELSPLVSNFSKNSVEERIIAIMKTKKLSIAAMLLAMILVVGAVAIFATSAKDKTDAAVSFDETESAVAPALYQGEASTILMPIDLTYSDLDVAELIDQLHASPNRAVYMDSELALRVTTDNAIMVSQDNGGTWKEKATDAIEPKEFAVWLLKHDTNPGYSIKGMQKRLADGAEVKHAVFENGKEIYVVMDRNGVQLVLVQPEKIASVLLDGRGMMITSERFPIHISERLLKSFYELLVSGDVMTKAYAEQDYLERITDLKEHEIHYVVTD